MYRIKQLFLLLPQQHKQNHEVIFTFGWNVHFFIVCQNNMDTMEYQWFENYTATVSIFSTCTCKRFFSFKHGDTTLYLFDLMVPKKNFKKVQKFTDRRRDRKTERWTYRRIADSRWSLKPIPDISAATEDPNFWFTVGWF